MSGPSRVRAKFHIAADISLRNPGDLRFERLPDARSRQGEVADCFAADCRFSGVVWYENGSREMVYTFDDSDSNLCHLIHFMMNEMN